MTSQEQTIYKILTQNKFKYQPVVIGRVKSYGLGYTLQKVRKELLIKRVRKTHLLCYDKHTGKEFTMLFSDVESIDGMEISRLAESLKINN